MLEEIFDESDVHQEMLEAVRPVAEEAFEEVLMEEVLQVCSTITC